MQWHLLWYILAGLILGLTASTLWEWLYFRRKRMELRDQRVIELEAELRLLQQQNQDLVQLAARLTPVATDYHRPAVFLESEEAESLRDDTYSPQYDDTPEVTTQSVEDVRDTAPVGPALEAAPDSIANTVTDTETGPVDDAVVTDTVIDSASATVSDTAVDATAALAAEEDIPPQPPDSSESPIPPMKHETEIDSTANTDEVGEGQPDGQEPNGQEANI